MQPTKSPGNKATGFRQVFVAPGSFSLTTPSFVKSAGAGVDTSPSATVAAGRGSGRFGGGADEALLDHRHHQVPLLGEHLAPGQATGAGRGRRLLHVEQ